MRTDDNEGLELHERVLSGDVTASADVFEKYLSPIIERLSKREGYRHLTDTDPELIWDSVSDAIFAYLANPKSYNPEKSSLMSYLAMSANGDLLNALARRTRRRGREEPLDGDVELSAVGGNGTIELPGEHLDSESKLWSHISALVPDPLEQSVIRLMLDGERSREVYADALGVSHLPTAERNRKVDRVKDRLKKRLQRAGRPELLDS
jgi:DNA-directed RNA polymerase specialized sigma24 family protein